MISLLLAAIATPAPEPPQLFGLVIGWNQSDDQHVPDLRYADDDAVKNARLLSELGGEIVLLTELDPDSARLFGSVQAARPTRAAIDSAMIELRRRIASTKAAGRPAELFIFYSGHGEVKNNEGYIQLADDRLYRRDFKKLLLGTEADQVHAIVDACKSYFLVFDRGPGGERWRIASDDLVRADELPEHVGLLLSTSSAQDSHEWEAFQSGIFSHEVRSALRGAADLDGDGRISYEETAAFVFGANRSIPNARYRPQFFVRSPKRAALLMLEGRTGDRLITGPGVSAHLFLEDARGDRLVDFHPDRARSVELLVPKERPLFVREVGRMVEWVSERPGSIILALLTPQRMDAQPRGAEHLAFGALFSRPFDDGTLLAYREERSAQMISTSGGRSVSTWMRPSLGVLSLGLGLTGGLMTALAFNEQQRADPETPHRERSTINRRIEAFNVTAIFLYSLAGGAAASFLVWTFWPEERPAITVITDGASVRVDF